MPRRPKPTACVVCHRLTIVPDAAKNHAYGAAWENRCFQCGSNQTECAWFAKLYEMPKDISVTLQCPFIVMGSRCTQMYTYPLGDLLQVDPNRVQFRCPTCDTAGYGEDLVRSNKTILEQIAYNHHSCNTPS